MRGGSSKGLGDNPFPQPSRIKPPRCGFEKDQESLASFPYRSIVSDRSNDRSEIDGHELIPAAALHSLLVKGSNGVSVLVVMLGYD